MLLFRFRDFGVLEASFDGESSLSLGSSSLLCVEVEADGFGFGDMSSDPTVHSGVKVGSLPKISCISISNRNGLGRLFPVFELSETNFL